MTRAPHEIGGGVPADSLATPGFSSLSDSPGPVSERAPGAFRGEHRPAGWTQRMAVEARAMFDDGASDDAIGRAVGRSARSVATWRGKVGLQRYMANATPWNKGGGPRLDAWGRGRWQRCKLVAPSLRVQLDLEDGHEDPDKWLYDAMVAAGVPL